MKSPFASRRNRSLLGLIVGASAAFGCGGPANNGVLDAAAPDLGAGGRGPPPPGMGGGGVNPPGTGGAGGNSPGSAPDAGNGPNVVTGSDGPPGDGAPAAVVGSRYGVAPFVLKPEWTGPCVRAERIDVNRGHAAEAFVRAAHCQIKGTEPPEAVLTTWATRLRTLEYVRRVDVVKTFCNEAGRTASCPRDYSDPWQAHPLLEATCQRSNTRDVGAVLMFWSNCPGRTNCEMDWANTHSFGMQQPHELYGNGRTTTPTTSAGGAGSCWKRVTPACSS